MIHVKKKGFSMSAATPRPWKRRDSIAAVIEHRGQAVASAVSEADAELIVKAVNLFDYLVAACQAFAVYDSDDNHNDGDDVALMLDYADAREKIKAVLAKAKVAAVGSNGVCVRWSDDSIGFWDTYDLSATEPNQLAEP